MHASMVLSEKVLSVEIIVYAFVARHVGVQIRVARADIAAIEAQLEMLDRDVTFPLIFGTQGDITAIVGKRADELALGGF